jgi:hypothetical protein
MHLEKQKEKKIFEHTKGAYKRKKMEEYRWIICKTKKKKLEENERKLENMNENKGVFTIVKSSVVTIEN